MIVTVTMNPALDKTARVSHLVPGGLNRLEGITTDPGGKGINVSRTIAALSGESIATGFLAGGAGEQIAAMLGLTEQPGQITSRFVRIAGQTRTNLKVLTTQFGITEFNEPGPAPTQADLDQLTSILTDLAAPGVIVVLSGSLPPEVAPTIYRDLIEAVKARGATTFLDADQEAFRYGLTAHPDMVKPNAVELGWCFGLDHTPGLAECVTLAGRLIDDGISMVAVSLGADGAVFVTDEGVLRAPGVSVEAKSTVGAGDAMVAALVYARDTGMSWTEAGRLAMAVSAGAVLTEGTNPPSRELIGSIEKTVIINEIKDELL